MATSYNTYSTWKKGEGFSDKPDDDFWHENDHISSFTVIFYLGLSFIIFLFCCGVCANCVRYWKRRRENINANPSRPAFEIYPPVNQEEVRIPIANNDIPHNYAAYVEPTPTAPTYNDSINNYPPVTEEKTPPPAYTTVVPFK